MQSPNIVLPTTVVLTAICVLVQPATAYLRGSNHLGIKVNITTDDMEEQAVSALSVPRRSLVGPREQERADAVRDALRHLWRGYKQRAWGADEVKPITGDRGGSWGEVGMMILDTLDSLWLAGLNDEFLEGQHWVESLTFRRLDHESRTSLFEMTIRGLAGLLACHALSGRAVFLDKAILLGDALMHGFPQGGAVGEYPWPVSYIDVHNPTDVELTPSFHRGYTTLADAASNIVEMGYLSQASGNTRYKASADLIMKQVMDLSENQNRPLAARTLSPHDVWFASYDTSVGALADSYFEYLLKGYLQGGRKNHRLLKAWKAAMTEMKHTLVDKSADGLTFIREESGGSRSMDHLTCFIGGMLALGSRYVPATEVEAWWLPLAVELTHTCHEMYHRTASGLAPEISSFGSSMVAQSTVFRLRPETLESLYYMFHVTGNTTYREWSWEIFQAINKHTRVKYGFAAVEDVNSVPVSLIDSEETFMGAETLKYALLVHLPPEALPLDRFVLNTEAHPVLIDGATINS